VLFMTSVSSRQPVGSLALSTIFRAGVAALAKMLADEWASEGIRVNHLIPGRIATDRLAEIDEDAARRRGVAAGEIRAEIERSIPLGRYGEPAEYAAAAAYLLSDAAAYVTGATLAVDGGLVRSIT
jgi:3-oxoacyl-[acyl-carrier protein] reductase